MDYNTQQDGADYKVNVNGRLSFDDNATFRKLLSDVGQSGSKNVVFDLSQLVAIDSAGLGMLLMAADTSSTEGWKMSIAGATGEVLKMLELTHVNRVVTMV